MPYKLRKACNWPGCPELTDGRFCTAHETETQQGYDRERGSAAARGYDARWRRIRLMVLREQPLCEHHLAKGQVVPAREVDHVDGNVRNVDRKNLRSLCKPCHSRKTARENGGLGNPGR